MLSVYIADTWRSTWKESLLWSHTSNFHAHTQTHTTVCSKYLYTTPYQSRDRQQRSKQQQTCLCHSYFTLKLIIQHIKQYRGMDMTDGGGIFKRYIKRPPDRNGWTKFPNNVTHLGAPGGQGVSLTSSVAIKDLQSRNKSDSQSHRLRGTTLIDSWAIKCPATPATLY